MTFLSIILNTSLKTKYSQSLCLRKWVTERHRNRNIKWQSSDKFELIMRVVQIFHTHLSINSSKRIENLGLGRISFIRFRISTFIDSTSSWFRIVGSGIPMQGSFKTQLINMGTRAAACKYLNNSIITRSYNEWEILYTGLF